MFKFFSYNSLETMFLGKSEFDNNSFYISSVSDLLFIVEQFKKNNLNISADELRVKYKLAKQRSDQGLIHFIELDKDSLVNNLFEESDNGILSLDKKASNMKISPRFSISLICLKTNEINCYWDIEVYNEMEMNYLATESYE